MWNEFIRERDEKQARLKQERINREKAKTSKTASIQCDRRDALEKSDVAVQTEFPDVMDDLKEQIRQLTKIVADLTSLKNRHQREVRTNQLHDEDILSDSLSDILPFNAELSSNQPVPGNATRATKHDTERSLASCQQWTHATTASTPTISAITAIHH